LSSSDNEIRLCIPRTNKKRIGQKIEASRMCDPSESLAYPFDSTFRILGRRWAPEVLFEIMNGTVRYSQLQRVLPGISPRTLSVRITELEAAGVIIKTRHNANGCVYSLTKKGRDARQVLASIANFTVRWHRPT
ncbi:MAG TPA: helix-turn-helix domain-containing protein, partial [Candidatus Bathyarchaeia archaeon]|nr:helix-turn-helix domain-containing protein [Candidatus Bathyarchaeia archaeon]